MAPDERTVTIVVVSFNSARLLPEFFASLGSALEGVEASVVLSDNASTDDSIAVAASAWPGVIIVSSPTNRGYAAAINAGVRAAPPAQAVVVLNDDIRLAPGAIEPMLRGLEDPGVGVVVPMLTDGDGRLLKSQRREPTILRALGEAILGGRAASRSSATSEIVQPDAAYQTECDVAWASGCAWAISEACWSAVGPWDESLFLYGEDLDYALRVKDAGLRIRYTPASSAVHLVGPSHRDPRLWSMLMWNRYRVYRRRHGTMKGLIYRSALILNEGLRSMSGSQVHRAALRTLLFPSSRPPELSRR